MSMNEQVLDRARHPRRAQPREAGPRVIEWPQAWRHPQALTAFLRERYGQLRLERLGGSYGWVVREANRQRYQALGLETLGDYLERFERGTQGRMPYLTHLSIHRNVPALREFLHAPPAFGHNWVAGPRWDRLGGPELFVGQAGTRFAGIHQDHGGVHVGFCQISGSKRFIVFPPSDGRWLYRYRGSEFPYQLRNSHVRWFAPDARQRWPLLTRARPREIILHAGQALLLPANWWHATESLTDGITWNIRIVNQSNIAGVLGQHLLGLPRGLIRLVGTLGRD